MRERTLTWVHRKCFAMMGGNSTKRSTDVHKKKNPIPGILTEGEKNHKGPTTGGTWSVGEKGKPIGISQTGRLDADKHRGKTKQKGRKPIKRDRTMLAKKEREKKIP